MTAVILADSLSNKFNSCWLIANSDDNEKNNNIKHDSLGCILNYAYVCGKYSHDLVEPPSTAQDKGSRNTGWNVGVKMFKGFKIWEMESFFDTIILNEKRYIKS